MPARNPRPASITESALADTGVCSISQTEIGNDILRFTRARYVSFGLNIARRIVCSTLGRSACVAAWATSGARFNAMSRPDGIGAELVCPSGNSFAMSTATRKGDAIDPACGPVDPRGNRSHRVGTAVTADRRRASEQLR